MEQNLESIKKYLRRTDFKLTYEWCSNVIERCQYLTEHGEKITKRILPNLEKAQANIDALREKKEEVKTKKKAPKVVKPKDNFIGKRVFNENPSTFTPTQKQLDYMAGKISLSDRLYWTEQRCAQTVREFVAAGRTTQDLRMEHRTCYEKLHRQYRYLLFQFPTYRPSKYPEKHKYDNWSIEQCIAYSRTFRNAKEEKTKDRIFYNFLNRNGIAHQVHQSAGHKLHHATGYYTARALLRKATDYDEFVEQYPEAYAYILSVPSLKEALIDHFRGVNRERIHSEESVRVWQEGQSGYRCMTSSNDLSRVIYVCEFPQTGRAYVGLTCDPKRRRMEHGQISEIKSSAVAKYKWENGLDFTFRILTDFMPEEEAQKAEEEWERKYREAGWEVLNIAPTGSLGGSGVYGVKYWKKVKDPELRPVPDFVPMCISFGRKNSKKEDTPASDTGRTRIITYDYFGITIPATFHKFMHKFRYGKLNPEMPEVFTQVYNCRATRISPFFAEKVVDILEILKEKIENFSIPMIAPVDQVRDRLKYICAIYDHSTLREYGQIYNTKLKHLCERKTMKGMPTPKQRADINRNIRNDVIYLNRYIAYINEHLK